MNTNKRLTSILGVLGLTMPLALPIYAQEQPQTFSLNGELRARYESLDGQFRSGKSGSDQLLLFRTLLHGKYNSDNYTFGLEMQDSRTYLGDAGTPLSSSYTNTTDLLQGYVKLNNLPGLLPSSKNQLTIGRQTVSIGSKRQIERVSYANVIKSYSGIYAKNTANNQDELHAFYLVPIERLPKARQAIDDNDFEFDKEQWQRRIWGLHYRKANLFATGQGQTWGELFAYGFDESDTTDTKTANRHYLTIGLRLFKPSANNQWNYDIEAAYRTGSRHKTSDIDDNQDLNVKAKMLLFRVGYTFNHPLNPNFAFQYYLADGDKNPNDHNFDQFERLFGGRRTDLNNTSIHGPLTPANLSAAGFRLELKPNSNWDARLHYSAAYLDSASDSFIIGKYRDTTGMSGDFLGHTLDSRFRYWFDDKKIILEAGLSWFFHGEYIKNLRNNVVDTQSTNLGYLQIAYKF